jgi:tetratricopeptide (TPR) repeat protein
MAPRPADRWPSVDALLAELARDPGAASRRVAMLAGAVLAVAGAGAAAFGIGRRAAVPEPCAAGQALAASLWDDTARERARAAFERTGRGYADDTFVRVDAALRRRLDAWARGHREACEATHVRHEQPAELLDARMACLGRARSEIASLVALLGEADAAALDRAAGAAGQVGDVSVCENLVALRDAVPAPTDPVQARIVEGLRGELAHLEALRLLGKMQEGLAAGHALVDKARAVGFAPVLAAALDKTVWFEVTSGNDDAAIALGTETARVAAEARDDALVASGLMGVAFALGYDKQQFDSAEVAFQAAQTAAVRAGNPGELLERLYGDREAILYQRGEHLVVLPICQIVYALSVHLHGLESYQAALSLSEIADAMHNLRFANEAAGIFSRALATAENALGPEHPIVLAIVGNAGLNKVDDFDFDGAAPYFARHVEGAKKLYGPDDLTVALAMHNLGMTRSGQRRLPEARALLERALHIRLAKLRPEHPMIASTLYELAEVARLEGHTDEALADLDRAAEIDRRSDATSARIGLARRNRAKAELLVGLGRLAEARAALALAEKALANGTDPTQRALTITVGADLLRAEGRPRDAVAEYARAMPELEARYGKNGPGIVDALLGLGEAELAAGDIAAALASAERAVTIGTYRPLPADQLGAAEFLEARARYARGDDRPAALATVRAVRGRLAALPYRAEALPRIDRWLAAVSPRER